MSESIKELKEVVEAVNEVSLVLVKLLKDGVQLVDAVSLVDQVITNAELKAKLVAATEGISKIPSEVKDIDLQEVLELASLEIVFVPKLVAALKA